MDLDCSFERRLWRSGVHAVAGLDEAGRGPLAGPVVAAAVIFPPEVWISGVDDSKRLAPERREELAEVIRGLAVAVGVGVASVAEIDSMNILAATMEAMVRAVGELRSRPAHLLVDGNRFTSRAIPATTIVRGDARCHSVAAASIVAKVARDAMMRECALQWPRYGFERHKGYGTAAHLEAIRAFGPCPIHRRSFRLPGQEIEHGDREGLPESAGRAGREDRIDGQDGGGRGGGIPAATGV
jgi:ribonuclease HII